MTIFANRLKQLRTEHDLTQKELAEILYVSQNAIFNWENGKREPSIDMIKNIANYFCVSVDYLVGLDKLLEELERHDLELNYDNEEREHLLKYYYKMLERTGRDTLMEILANLLQLNDTGQEEASKRVEELTEIPRYTKKHKKENNTVGFSKELTSAKDFLLPNAAHADDYENAPEKLKQQEESIMDDENF